MSSRESHSEKTPQQPEYRRSDIDCDVVIIGAGPGGYSAAFRAADLGLHVVLIERYENLGGVCLNVGCIPSKTLLHVAEVMRESEKMADTGVNYRSPDINLEQLRKHKDSIISKLTDGLASMSRMRKVARIHGMASFLDEHRVQVHCEEGDRIFRFRRAIIAAGSRPVKLPFLPKDERIVDSTGALKLSSVPDQMLIIGGGIIGLEMATVYSALGATVDVVELMDEMLPGVDRDLVDVWKQSNSRRFGKMMTNTRVTEVEAHNDGLRVGFDGELAPEAPCIYDRILQCVGRRPNSDLLGLEMTNVAVEDTGFVSVDSQMRTHSDSIFAIGDIVGQPMLAHKAVQEAHIAAEVVTGEILDDSSLSRHHFDARVVPAVAYTDPEIAWVGVTESEAKASGLEVRLGAFPWSASGRALAKGQSLGLSKIIFDANTHRIVGGGVVGAHAGELIGEVALAIEMDADAVDLGKTIHPHPTLIETISLAADASEGICVDLPPLR